MRLIAVCAIDLEKKYLSLLKRNSTVQIELINGKTPTRGSDDAAGLDLYASQSVDIQAGT